MAQNRGGDTSKGLAVSFQRLTNFSSVGAFKGALLSHSNLNCIDSEKKRASGAAGIAFACANDGDDSPRLLWELLINCIAQLADILLMIGELKDNGFFMIGSYVIVVCSRLLSGAEWKKYLSDSYTFLFILSGSYWIYSIDLFDFIRLLFVRFLLFSFTVIWIPFHLRQAYGPLPFQFIWTTMFIVINAYSSHSRDPNSIFFGYSLWTESFFKHFRIRHPRFKIITDKTHWLKVFRLQSSRNFDFENHIHHHTSFYLPFPFNKDAWFQNVQ